MALMAERRRAGACACARRFEGNGGRTGWVPELTRDVRWRVCRLPGLMVGDVERMELSERLAGRWCCAFVVEVGSVDGWKTPRCRSGLGAALQLCFNRHGWSPRLMLAGCLGFRGWPWPTPPSRRQDVQYLGTYRM